MNNTILCFGIFIAVLVLGAIIADIIEKRHNKELEKDTFLEVQSFRQAMDLVGLPIVTLFRGKTPMNFIIDTGSTCCVLNSCLVTDESSRTTSVMGVEGNEKTATYHAMDVYLNSHKYTIEYVSNDLNDAFLSIKNNYGVTLHGILGSDFFAGNNYIIDFEKYIFYTNKK